jgi:hypothetical protein
LRRGEEESLAVFNMRFFSVYHSMPVVIRPTQTTAMMYYVMAQHPELVLLLRERKYSSLRHLFEDAVEVEENIRARMWVHRQAYNENLHVHEQEDCQSISYSEQEDSEYESDLEQQKGSRYDSKLESGSSTFVDFSMGRNAYQSYDQFPEHFEHVLVDDCIDNYMFLDDHSYDGINPAAPLSCDHSYEGETTTVDDQELVSKEQGGHLFASRDNFIEEQPGLLKQPRFCHIIHDPMAIYMESYISDFLKFSNFITSPILTGVYGAMKYFQDHIVDPFPLLIKEKHWVEINYPRLVENIEKHVKEELSGKFISYPQPIIEQVSLGINQPASVLHPPVHSENIT